MSLRADLKAVKATSLFVAAILVGSTIAVTILAASASSGPAGDVPVSLVNFRILMPNTLRAGHHTFAVTNDGTVPHEFVVFRTAVLADALPLRPDGDVNEDSPLLQDVADSGPTLGPGQGRSVPVVKDASVATPTAGTLSPGHYVAVCNLPAHYRLGMRIDLTVIK